MFGLFGFTLDILMLIIIVSVVLVLARIIGKIILTLAGFSLLIAAILFFIVFNVTLWWMFIAGILALLIKLIW